MPRLKRPGLAALADVRAQTHNTDDQVIEGAPDIRVSASSNAPSRFDDLYNSTTHKWAPSYVQPTAYRLLLHRTKAQGTATNPIKWRLESMDGRFGPVEVTDNGVGTGGFGAARKGTITATVPLAGPISVSSTWKGNKITGTINLRDFLIVSIGDSFSSGQGNPDRVGTETVGSGALCEVPTLIKLVQAIADAKEKGLDWVEDNVPGLGTIVNLSEDLTEGLIDVIGDGLRGLGGLFGLDDGPEQFIHMSSPPRWLEPLAWRSLKSSMSLATQAAEIRGWSRLTTFVSVAASGATIDSGLLGPQYQFQKTGQIEEVRRMLANPRDRTNLIRPVDVLMMSIGGNDCGFSGTLSDLTSERFIVGLLGKKTQKEARETIEKAIGRLPAKYDQLGDTIRRTLNPKAILVPEYPAPIFDGANRQPQEGCGVFDLTEGAGLIYPMGISKSDAAFIEEMGNLLNETVSKAAARNGWTVIGGVARAFKGHGYCATNTYWRGASESCHMQDDLEGTAHPNEAGTRVVADLIAERLHLTLNDFTKNDPTAGVRRMPPKKDDQVVGRR